ncbi:Spy/CpxP family protein refolding chaperone [Rosettibacter firmus]|uniref:Spy/CpxP family protein refolding chaperone n=1 Tax=Rosettibacter firmus TaxID=3111522 RepID=UPI00336C20B6
MKKLTYLSVVLFFLFAIRSYSQPLPFENIDEDFDHEFVESEEEFIDNPIDTDESVIEFSLPGGMQIHKGLMRERLINKLNLTDEQKKQFSNLQNEHQKKMIDLRAQIQKNRLDIKNMMLQNKIDEKKLLDLVQANNKLLSDIRTASINHWLAVYKILNDEQKEIWAKHWAYGAGFGKKVIIKNKIFDRQRMKGCR